VCPCSDTRTTDEENKNALSNEEFHIHVNERIARNTVNLDRNQQRTWSAPRLRSALAAAPACCWSLNRLWSLLCVFLVLKHALILHALDVVKIVSVLGPGRRLTGRGLILRLMAGLQLVWLVHA
jgi:hypothetical protein